MIVTPELMADISAGVPPKAEVQPSGNGPRRGFDVRAYLEDHGFEVIKEKPHDGGTLFVLGECPFNPEHTSGESAVYRNSKGVLHFRCFHNSCKGKTWHDLRKLVGDSKPAPIASLDETLPTLYARAPLTASDLGRVPPPPREWVCTGPGALPRGIVATSCGQGGCGKTLLELQIGMTIASGVQCIDAFPITARGPVLLVLSEYDEDEIERRIYNIREAYDAQHADLTDLHIFPAGGDPRLIERDQGGNIRTTAGFDELMAHVQRIEPVYMVIDSISTALGDAEESNKDGATAVSLARQFAATNGQPAVVLLGHVNKGSLAAKSKGKTPEAALDPALDPMAVRGPGAIVFNTRWTRTMTKVPKRIRQKLGADHAPLVAYAVRKTNYGQELERAYLSQDQNGVLRAFEPNEVKRVNLSEELLKEVAEKGGVPKREFLETSASSALRDRTMANRDELREAVRDLLETGELVEEKRGKKLFLVAAVAGGE